MKIKTLLIIFAVLAAFLLSSCNSAINPLGKDTPDLFPIWQNDMLGYINKKGEVVIQPQFKGGLDLYSSSYFSEGLAVACIESNKCGYIDEKGKFVINPQFEAPSRFSEGLAAVGVREQIGNTSKPKIGYIDKTGKFIINPQFDSISINEFSEGLANVKIGDKHGFIDKAGRIVINPQFKTAFPFTEGLASVEMDGKWGFVDKEGKIVVNPQFEQASPFTNGLAAVQIGKQYGYVDKSGKIIINPQFDEASPFSDEGLAMITIGGKVGFVDKEGKYVINPQFASYLGGLESIIFAISLGEFKEIGRASFSEGLALVKIGDSLGYIDKTGKIVINPQFRMAFPFYGGLAMVVFGSGSDKEMAYIDKEGKIVWRETKESSNTYSNSSMSNSNMMNTNMTKPMTNSNMMNSNMMSNSSSSQTTYTKEYEGTINNNYEITMTLTRSGDSFSGYVTPKSTGNSIPVRGKFYSGGLFDLSEYDDQNNWTGTYKGRFYDDGRIEGKWTKPDGSAERPLYMTEK